MSIIKVDVSHSSATDLTPFQFPVLNVLLCWVFSSLAHVSGSSSRWLYRRAKKKKKKKIFSPWFQFVRKKTLRRQQGHFKWKVSSLDYSCPRVFRGMLINTNKAMLVEWSWYLLFEIVSRCYLDADSEIGFTPCLVFFKNIFYTFPSGTTKNDFEACRFNLSPQV